MTTTAINSDVLEGKWKQIRGQLREHWGKLTDDDVDRVAGQYEQLVGALQMRYGKSRAAIEQEVDDFLNMQ